MMKKLQKLGKALMLPVAALPICGILMGLGYAIAPGVMGVPGAATSGALYNIGFLLVKAGGALIDHMALLFVIGVAVGLSDDREGTSALAGLVSWLMMTNLLSTGVVTTLMPAIADDQVKTLAFDKIENVFIAIIAGIIGSACYNRFKNAKLPDWLAFFSGKRCVAIVTGLVSILVSVVLLFVWPIIFSALVAVGEGIIGMDGIGAPVARNRGNPGQQLHSRSVPRLLLVLRRIQEDRHRARHGHGGYLRYGDRFRSILGCTVLHSRTPGSGLHADHRVHSRNRNAGSVRRDVHEEGYAVAVLCARYLPAADHHQLCGARCC